AADVVVRGVDLRPGEPEMPQEVETRIGELLGGNAERLAAEVLSERPLVEDKANVEGGGQRGLDLFQFARPEPVAEQCGVIDARRVAKRAVADGMGHDLLDLGRAVPERLQRSRN